MLLSDIEDSNDGSLEGESANYVYARHHLVPTDRDCGQSIWWEADETLTLSQMWVCMGPKRGCTRRLEQTVPVPRKLEGRNDGSCCANYVYAGRHRVLSGDIFPRVNKLLQTVTNTATLRYSTS